MLNIEGTWRCCTWYLRSASEGICNSLYISAKDSFSTKNSPKSHLQNAIPVEKPINTNITEVLLYNINTLKYHYCHTILVERKLIYKYQYNSSIVTHTVRYLNQNTPMSARTVSRSPYSIRREVYGY